MAEFATILLNATAYVLILVLVALGLMVIFGMMRVINMAHGELFMLGAYVVVATLELGLPFWLGALLAPLLVGGAGLVIERVLIRHVYRRPLDTILATWGLSIALKQAVVSLFGPAAYSVPLPVDQSLVIGDWSYPLYRLVLSGLAAATIGACFWLLLRTDFGLMARAVIARPEAAATLGIDVRRIVRNSFALGAALAGLAGALVAPLISVDPQMGLGYLVPAFLSILVGGAGALAGVLAGAGVVGGADSLLTLWLSPVAAQIVVFVLAVVVIRLRPSGLLGGRDAR
jgi:urea transport system permease protein